MIESIAHRGYAATTVAHVIGLAGVSRRAFYEHFRNKEACFLATFNIVVARSRKRVLSAWGSERGWDNRLHAAYKAFLEEVVEEPKGTHLVLIDSLGIGVRSRERLHLAGYAYERLLAEAFRTSADPVPLPRIASRAIVGGVRHIVHRRIREERLPELRTLADELLDWVEAYRTPMLARLKTMMRPQAPRIPLATAAFLDSDVKRARVLAAIVHLTMDEGYGELTDPHIAKFAGVSTEAFHKEFRSKEECYLAAIDEFAEETVDHVERVTARAETWPEAVVLGIQSFIYQAVARPALLRLAFVDLFELGPGMNGHLTTVTDRLTDALLVGSPEPRRAPEIAQEVVAGAIWDLFSAYSASDRIRYLPCLSHYISYFVLAPYIGAKEAIDAIERARSEPKILQGLTKGSSPDATAATALAPAKPKDAPAKPASARTRSESSATPKAESTAKAAKGRVAKRKATAGKSAPANAASGKTTSSKAPKQSRAKAEKLAVEQSTASRSRRRPPR